MDFQRVETECGRGLYSELAVPIVFAPTQYSKPVEKIDPTILNADTMPQIVLIGCVAGLSQAFNTPIGSLLFVLEEFDFVRRSHITFVMIVACSVPATAVSWGGNRLAYPRIRFRPVSNRFQTSFRPVPGSSCHSPSRPPPCPVHMSYVPHAVRFLDSQFVGHDLWTEPEHQCFVGHLWRTVSFPM